MLSLGYDIGSSFVKASIIDVETKKIVAGGYSPLKEMKIESPFPGWAEQNPDDWWSYITILTRKIIKENKIDNKLIKCIGITYQMHGLVIIDKNKKVLRPSIIWCDSRAVEFGNNAFKNIGEEFCLQHLLNSPGNFTASKLMWVKENEPELFKKIYKIMLPGEFIAMKMTGDILTTIPGLSEGVFWDFKEKKISNILLNYYGFDKSLLPEIKPVFSEQGCLTKDAANELGLQAGTVISYRAGDQPNNAFSLNVLEPGEVAATAGTSGVVYGVMDKIIYDPFSRVNQFVHVNNSNENNRIGVLLCINGTGILNSWVKNNFSANTSYDEINTLASRINIGADGLCVIPFGNGAERMLINKNIGSHILNIDLNRHNKFQILRAVQEGIAFSFNYGMNIMKEMKMDIKVIRAGKTNMFLSNVFTQTLADISGASIELFDTDGAQGAAKGAAIGAGYYKSFDEAFSSVTKVATITPINQNIEKCSNAYEIWNSKLKLFLDRAS